MSIKNPLINKKIISKDTLLVYPKFKKQFDIHKDASDKQLGEVISQKGVPIALYSCKLKLAEN